MVCDIWPSPPLTSGRLLSCGRVLTFAICGAQVACYVGLQTEKDSPEEIMKAFQLFDMDKTGTISLTNLKVCPNPKELFLMLNFHLEPVLLMPKEWPT